MLLKVPVVPALKATLHFSLVEALASREDDEREVIAFESIYRNNDPVFADLEEEARRAEVFLLADPTGTIFGTPETPRCGFVALHLYDVEVEDKHILNARFVFGDAAIDSDQYKLIDLKLKTTITGTEEIVESLENPFDFDASADEMRSVILQYLLHGQLPDLKPEPPQKDPHEV